MKLNRKNYNTSIPLLNKRYEELERLIEETRPPEYCHEFDYTLKVINGESLICEYDDVNPRPRFRYENKGDKGFLSAINDDRCRQVDFRLEENGDLYGITEE